MKLFYTCLLAALVGSAATKAAETEIDITKGAGIGTTQPVWVNLSGFTGEAAQVLQFDLYVQGFNFTNSENAQYLLSGSNNGNLAARAVDRYSKDVKVNKVYSGGTLRRQVHAFVDDFAGKLGMVPIAQTRIAFKNDSGSQSELFIADFDGANAQQITRDGSNAVAPCWAPGKLALYYTSYRLSHPDIFYHDLSSGTRKVFARFGGSNMSPAASPDGSKVAMILSKDGWPDLYVCNADGSGMVRLTKTREDESSPCWSPDSKWICFAAKINSRRALYRISPSGGEPRRIVTEGVLNPTEPDWSPDGKFIAFTSMMGGFEICVVPAEGGKAIQLVPGEDASWAPNSRTVVCARRQGGSRILSLLDVKTKQYKDVSRISGSSGSNSQPNWAK